MLGIPIEGLKKKESNEVGVWGRKIKWREKISGDDGM